MLPYRCIRERGIARLLRRWVLQNHESMPLAVDEAHR